MLLTLGLRALCLKGCQEWQFFMLQSHIQLREVHRSSQDRSVAGNSEENATRHLQAEVQGP